MSFISTGNLSQRFPSRCHFKNRQSTVSLDIPKSLPLFGNQKTQTTGTLNKSHIPLGNCLHKTVLS